MLFSERIRNYDMCPKYQIYKHAWVYKYAPHTEEALTPSDAQELLRKGGWLVRNTYGFDCAEQTPFWYVIKDTFGDLKELSTNTRNQVRHGLKNYTIRRITAEELLAQGYVVYCAAANAYKIPTQTPTKEEFENRIRHASTDTEYWGAFNPGNELAAFAINEAGEDYCSYQTLKANPADLKKYVYYALIYEMNRYYLQERRLKYVLDGARSITEHSNIQPFLENKFHFRKAYCHLRIHYIWWLKWIITCLYPLRKFIPNRQIQSLLAMHGMQS